MTPVDTTYAPDAPDPGYSCALAICGSDPDPVQIAIAQRGRAAAGLGVITSSDRPVPIARHGLELVGSYGGLAEVLMSGYPVEIASLCLQRGAARAFDRLGIAEVPRNWLEVTARRNQADPVGDTSGGTKTTGLHLQ